MRKVILTMHVSMDGFAEGPKGEMDWITRDNPELWEDTFEQFHSADAFLLGRGMYSDYSAYWRGLLAGSAGSSQELDYARLADKTPHLLFSKTLTSVDWPNTRIINKDVAGEVGRLKRESGLNMILLGGPGLASSFLNLGLVDELQLYIEPVLLGGGKPLFNHLQASRPLGLLGVKEFACGVVAHHYRLMNK